MARATSAVMPNTQKLLIIASIQLGPVQEEPHSGSGDAEGGADYQANGKDE
ncbi:hypothetical protein GCM10009097_06660 [Pigmentiphaga daeguensis]|uniref:Uncharacterized protein n=1 Tax=Pigmentiphaga daeguensis TaxID=414049 RepID=A0ABN1BA67_9BURK